MKKKCEWKKKQLPSNYCEGQFIKQPLLISKVFLRLHQLMFYIFYLALQTVVRFVMLMWVISIQSLKHIAELTVPKRHAVQNKSCSLCVLEWMAHMLLLYSQKPKNRELEWWSIWMLLSFLYSKNAAAFVSYHASCVATLFAFIKLQQFKSIQPQEVEIFARKVLAH